MQITDIAECHTRHLDAHHRLLVAVADGNVWAVTLPSLCQRARGAGIHQIVLERLSCDAVQWLYQLPGVQSIECTLAGLTSHTFMRSCVTPTTLIVSTLDIIESKMQCDESLELNELEGEQSTCTMWLHSQEPTHNELLQSLFPEMADCASMTAILQGDLDGSVRFCLVRHCCKATDRTKVSVAGSGTLLQLDQPVQAIVPFTSLTELPASTEQDTKTGKMPGIDALLLLGAEGLVKIVHSRRDCSIDAVAPSLKRLGIDHAVQSLAFVSHLRVFLGCSNGSAFVFRVSDVLVQAQLEDGKDVSSDRTICVEKLLFQPVRLSLSLLICAV